MVSKRVDHLGLSSASIAATESQFSISSVVEVAPPIAASAAAWSPYSAFDTARFNGRDGCNGNVGVCNSRPAWPGIRDAERSIGRRDQSPAPAWPSHQAGIRWRSGRMMWKESFSLVELVPPNDRWPEGDGLSQSPAIMASRPVLDAFGDGDLASRESSSIEPFRGEDAARGRQCARCSLGCGLCRNHAAGLRLTRFRARFPPRAPSRVAWLFSRFAALVSTTLTPISLNFARDVLRSSDLASSGDSKG